MGICYTVAMNLSPNPPIVMVLSGNDPSGGAGILADTLAITHMKAHVAPIVTTLTVQDTKNVKSYEAVSAKLITAQAETILDDMPIAAIKIGMIGSVSNITAIEKILSQCQKIPIILDPVLIATGQGALCDSNAVHALQKLFPYCTLITPNFYEAYILSDEKRREDDQASALYYKGAENVLITGGDAPTRFIKNRLYHKGIIHKTYQSERLPEIFHGSGCTFASAIAGAMATGLDLVTAINQANQFTYQSLKTASRLVPRGYHH